MIEPSLLTNCTYLSGIAVVTRLTSANEPTIPRMLTGAHTASTRDLVPGLFLIGLGGGASFGQLFQFILMSVSIREVRSASGVMEASQQLSTALGVAALGTIFFAIFKYPLPTDARRLTAWACLVPLAAAFALIFRLPMQAREEDARWISGRCRPRRAG